MENFVNHSKKSLVKHLKDLELKTYNNFSKMFHDGAVYLNIIIDKLKGREEGPITLLNLVKICNKRLTDRIGIDLRVSSFKKYQATESKLQDFINSLGKKDIRLKELKPPFIEDFNTR
mgnify:CR=1 FL=1